MGIRRAVQSLPSLCMTLNVSALGLVGSGSPDNMQELAWLVQFDIQCNAWESDVQCRALILNLNYSECECWLARQYGTVPAVGCSIQCNAWESDVQCRALILSMCMTLNVHEYNWVGRVWLARQYGTVPAVGCSRKRMHSWPSVDTWHSLLHRAVRRKRGEKYSQLLGGH